MPKLQGVIPTAPRTDVRCPCQGSKPQVMKQCPHVNSCFPVLPYTLPSLSDIIKLHSHACPGSCWYVLARYSDSVGVYTKCFQRRKFPTWALLWLISSHWLEGREDGARLRRTSPFCEVTVSGEVFRESPAVWRLLSFNKGEGGAFGQAGGFKWYWDSRLLGSCTQIFPS